MSEQRVLPRWRIAEPMKVRFQERYEFRDCMIEDMNQKGMCMSLPAQLPQDTLIRMGLELNKQEMIDVKVQISWIKEEKGRYTHGLEFSHVLDQDKEKIYKYISDHCMKQFEAGWWHDVK